MPIQESKKEIKRNMFNKHSEFYQLNPENAKAHRSEEVLNNIITHNDISLNANEKAMDRIDRVIDVANWQYNKFISQGESSESAYQKAYIDNEIDWKTAEDNFVTLTVEDLADFQKKALFALSEIWKKYG